jgi:hypothetical protein
MFKHWNQKFGFRHLLWHMRSMQKGEQVLLKQKNPFFKETLYIKFKVVLIYGRGPLWRWVKSIRQLNNFFKKWRLLKISAG